MSGLDKIIEHITREAGDEAAKVLSSAKEEAEKILASGKEEADNMAAAIKKQSEAEVAQAADRIRSMAELREKRMILQAKQDRIEEVITGAKDYLLKLDDKDYFDMIKKMLERYASGKKGTICFSAADLKRLPADMESIAAKYGLELSKEPADIDGGFILSYGDIEENCSFDVLIESSKEELQDKIGQTLWCD